MFVRAQSKLESAHSEVECLRLKLHRSSSLPNPLPGPAPQTVWSEAVAVEAENAVPGKDNFLVRVPLKSKVGWANFFFFFLRDFILKKKLAGKEKFKKKLAIFLK